MVHTSQQSDFIEEKSTIRRHPFALPLHRYGVLHADSCLLFPEGSEPTSGLHCADTDHLVAPLQTLVETGNTVVAAGHDMRVIAVVNHMINLGSGAGNASGTVVAAGTREHVADKGVGAFRGLLRFRNASSHQRDPIVTSVSLCDVNITQRHTRRIRGLRRGA